jgi:hypothetical protein
LRPFPALKVILALEIFCAGSHLWKPSMLKPFGASHLLGSYLLWSSHVRLMWSYHLLEAGFLLHICILLLYLAPPTGALIQGGRQHARSSFVARSIWLSHIR